MSITQAPCHVSGCESAYFLPHPCLSLRLLAMFQAVSLHTSSSSMSFTQAPCHVPGCESAYFLPHPCLSLRPPAMSQDVSLHTSSLIHVSHSDSLPCFRL